MFGSYIYTAQICYIRHPSIPPTRLRYQNLDSQRLAQLFPHKCYAYNLFFCSRTKMNMPSLRKQASLNGRELYNIVAHCKCLKPNRCCHRSTIANRSIPMTPPNSIATGGLTRNHATATNAVAVMATSQGSVPSGNPPCIVAVRYPICHNLYTAAYTSPTADAFTPRRIDRNHFRERKMRHKPVNPTTISMPGV